MKPINVTHKKGKHLRPSTENNSKTAISNLHPLNINKKTSVSQKKPHQVEEECHCFSGIVNREITPEFLIEIALSVTEVLGEAKKILLSMSDNSQYMMPKFALLSGCMAGGAEVYNLIDGGDRSITKFAINHLHLDGGIFVQCVGERMTIELFNHTGAPMSKDSMGRIKWHIKEHAFHRANIEKLRTPINVSHMAQDYFRHLVATTPIKRLNYSIALCIQNPETQGYMKRIGTAFGLSLFFTNEPKLLPELIQKNKLDFGLLVGQNGKFGLLDEHGHIIDGDAFYAFITLIVASAVENATVYLPEHTSGLAEAIAEVCGASVSRVADYKLENQLLAENTVPSRLQHNLCFDPICSMIRICEFLYLNKCSFSYVCRLISEYNPCTVCSE
ncbi:MAG: hypothetical protein E7393_05165 [Ruminococcaceae bacterium]|nr:hypothetical protein [Oscillospiraceae bacterium]